MEIEKIEMKVNRESLQDIDRKKRELQNRPDCYMKAQKIMDNNFRLMADLHSFWLEHPAITTRFLSNLGYTGNPNNLEEVRRFTRRISREGTERLERAWKYLSERNTHGDLSRTIRPADVIEVLRYVEPGINAGGYRRERATLGLKNFIPPNPVRVPEYVEMACEKLKGRFRHPVEDAALIHLLIAGIQPGRDGNKRSARLFQNRILRDGRLPPAMIRKSSRTDYLNHLEFGLQGVRDGNERYVSVFGNYVANRVNSTLDEVLAYRNGQEHKH